MEERRARRVHGTCRWLILGLVLAFQARFARADVVAPGLSVSDDEFMARVPGPSPRLAQKVVRSMLMADAL
jgi:hypothetical protein